MAKIKQHTSEPTLDMFFDALRTVNPYFSNRVNDALQGEVDVLGIHQSRSQHLIDLVNSSVNNRTGHGAMVLGGAGVGKSHLLMRLATWAKDHRAIYLYLHNVLASPENMPQHFLRYTMSMLVRSSNTYKESPLYDLIHRAIKKSLKAAKLGPQQSSEKCQKTFSQFCDQFPLLPDSLNRQLVNVLFAFFKIVNSTPKIQGAAQDKVQAVVDFLSGNPIDVEAGKAIGLDVDSLSRNEDGLLQLTDSQQLKQVILLLSELAAADDRGFIISVDQVDNLDKPQVQALTRFLHALIDHAHNLVVVVSGVHQTMVNFRESEVIAEASWDRLTERIVELPRITSEEAYKVVSSRQQSFINRFKEIPEIKELLEKHELFPLPVNEFEKRYGESVEVRPRDVISWARDQWQLQRDELVSMGSDEWLKNWPTGEIIEVPEDDRSREQRIDAMVQAKIREALAQLGAAKGSLPPDADNLATLVHDLLKHCLGRKQDCSLRSIKRIEGKNPSYHLEVLEEDPSGESILNGVCFITTKGNSSTAALKRLLHLKSKMNRRILVTDEERAPLPMTDAAAIHYAALNEMGDEKFRHIKITFHQYAQLDAWRSVIGQAGSGDLDIKNSEGVFETVSEKEAVDSMHRLKLFANHPLLGELTQEPNREIIAPLDNKELDEAKVRLAIKGTLDWAISLTSNELTQTYIAEHGVDGIGFDFAHKQVINISQKMAVEKAIRTQPCADGLLLLIF